MDKVRSCYSTRLCSTSFSTSF